MNKWKIAFWVCFTFLIVSILFSYSRIVRYNFWLRDLSYEIEHLEADNQVLIKIINQRELTKDKILEVLTIEKRTSAVFDSNTLMYDNFDFVFKGDTLVSLKRR